MSSFQPVRGTHDLLPDEFRSHRLVTDTARKISARYGFKEMATPIFEFAQVFSRTMGETSDVVTKEMYTFSNHGGEEQMALRPEFTAGICRAFVSNSLYDQIPFKVFAAGPLFRYERPQKGRQRQFHQIDAEILGASGPAADVELLALAQHILEELKVSQDVTLKVNTLGDSESRAIYREKLIAYLEPYKFDLSDVSRTRLQRNPLRILDSKSERDREIVANAPLLKDHLNNASQKFFDEVCKGLTNLGIGFSVDLRLVRGLDYYTHTAFEFVTDKLGAQGAVIAGGRYDGLVEQLGGRSTPGVGWAGGVERLIMMAGGASSAPRPIAIIPIGEAAEMRAQLLARDLRKAGFSIVLEYSGNTKRRFNRANKTGANAALIIGDLELNKDIVTIRDMITGEQQELTLASLVEYLAPYR